MQGCENFARGCKIHQFREACKIPSSLRKFRKGLWKFLKGLRNSSVSQRLRNSFLAYENFARGWKIDPQIRKTCEIPSWAIRKGLRNSWMLDSFSDSLPCILDWFDKGFEALLNLDSSCNLASILLCNGLYQVIPHSWLVLMIKKLSKTSKLAKNW